jgi:excisionase family DNA binding protein
MSFSNDEADVYLTTGQVAKRLNVSPQTVRHYIHTNQLQAKRLTRQLRIRSSAVQAFLDSE